MESITVTASPATNSAASAAGAVRRLGQRLFGDDGFGFKDILDLVNPLQHIPVVGNVYRKLTGDVLAPAIRVAGGALFGGPLGAGLSLVGLTIEEGAKRGAAAAEAAAAAAAPTNVASAAPTSTPRPTVPRGGWMIAAASTGRFTGFAPDEAVASNAAIAAAEAATAAAPLSVAAIPAEAAPPTRTAEPEMPAPMRELRLPGRRAFVPLPETSPAPATEPLAAASPRSDPRALARFLAWQSALERATTELRDYA